MKRLTAVVSTLFLPALLCAQPRGGSVNLQPTLRGSFGNVVFPGGGGNLPGITRSYGNVVFPGGGGPHLNVPLSSQDPTRQIAPFGVPPRNFGRNFVGTPGRRPVRSSRSSIYAVPYAVPVYLGGESYYGGYGEGYPPEQAAPAPGPSQPSVVVVYPQAAQPVYGDRYGNPPAESAQPQSLPLQPSAVDSATAEPSHYLIAFKDHTIYSAVAYWVDGNTLHYFTSGSTHNQVSLSLVDRELTDRLNRESGNTVQLPRN